MESVNEMIIVVACASTFLWLDLYWRRCQEIFENIRPWVAQEISINYIQKLFAPMEQTGVFVRKTMSTCIQTCISISICMCICIFMHAYPWFTQQSCSNLPGFRGQNPHIFILLGFRGQKPHIFILPSFRGQKPHIFILPVFRGQKTHIFILPGFRGQKPWKFAHPGL